MNNRCTHCSGTLILSQDRSKWICEYCDSEFAVNSQSNINAVHSEPTNARSYYIGSVKVTQEALQRINTYLSANQKLDAVKFIREFSGLGLKEAVSWLDDYQKNSF